MHAPIDRRREPACHSFMIFPRILRRSHAIAAAYVAAKTPFSSIRPLHASAALRALDMAKVDTSQRLAELRKLMKERNVDIYSRPSLASICRRTYTADAMQWSPPKTAIRASTLPHVTPAEVRTGTPAIRRTSHLLTPPSIHQWFHGFCWLRRHHTRQGCPLDRRALFQPGREAAGQQLGTAEAGHPGRANHPRVDC